MANVLGTAILELSTDDSGLERGLKQAEAKTRSWLSGFNRLLSGLAIGGLAIQGVRQMADAVSGVVSGLIGQNLELEHAQAQLLAFTKDAGLAAQILSEVRQEAAATPFAFREMAAATASLLPAAKQSGAELMELVRLAEILAASNPAQGLEGAAFALREALSGDFTSIIERFNLPRQRINQLKEEGVPALEAVRRAMQEMGLDMSLVSNLAQTASGRWSTFVDSLNAIKAAAVQPFFEALSRSLVPIQEWLDTNQDRLNALATAVGERLAGAFILVRDAAITFVQAVSGDWVDDQRIRPLHRVLGLIGSAIGDIVDGFQHLADEGPVNTFEAIGERIRDVWVLVRDAVLTFVQALQGNWADAPGIRGVHRAVGLIGLTIRDEIIPAIKTFFETLRSGEGDGSFASQFALGLRNVAALVRDDVLPALVAFGAWFTSTAIPALQQFWTAAQPVVSQVFGFIRDNLPTILPMLATFGATFVGLSTLVGPVQGLTSSLGTLFTVLRTGLAATSALSALVGVLGGPVTLAIIAAAAAVAGLFLAWKTNFLGIRDIVGQVWAFLQPIIGAIVEHFRQFAEEIAPLAADAWANIKTVILTAVGAIGEIVTTVFGAVRGFIEEHRETILTILGGAWKQVQGIVQIALSLIEGLVKVTLAVIGGNWGEAWNALKEMLAGVWDGIQQVISGRLDILKGALDLGLAALKQLWESVWGGLRDAAGALLEGVTGKVEEAIAGIKGLFTGAGEWLYQAGVDIVQGLIDGLGSMLESVKQKAQEIGDAVSGAVKGVLQIGSPSKVLAEIGQDAVAGLIAGMDQEKAELTRAAAEAVRGAVEAIRAVLELAGEASRRFQEGLELPSLDLLAKLRDFGVAVAGQIAEAVPLFAEEVTQGIGRLAGAIRDSMDAVSAVFELARQLSGVDPDEALRVATEFFEALPHMGRVMVQQLAEGLDRFAGVDLERVSQLAQTISAVLDPMRGVLELIGQVDETLARGRTLDLPGSLLDRLKELALALTRAFSEVAGQLSTETLAAAQAFAESFRAVVDAVSPVVEAMEALRTLRALPQRALDAFAGNVRGILATLAGLRAEVASGIPDAQALIDGLAQIAERLQAVGQLGLGGLRGSVPALSMPAPAAAGTAGQRLGQPVVHVELHQQLLALFEGSEFREAVLRVLKEEIRTQR